MNGDHASYRSENHRFASGSSRAGNSTGRFAPHAEHFSRRAASGIEMPASPRSMTRRPHCPHSTHRMPASRGGSLAILSQAPRDDLERVAW